MALETIPWDVHKCLRLVLITHIYWTHLWEQNLRLLFKANREIRNLREIVSRKYFHMLRKYNACSAGVDYNYYSPLVWLFTTEIWQWLIVTYTITNGTGCQLANLETTKLTRIRSSTSTRSFVLSVFSARIPFPWVILITNFSFTFVALHPVICYRNIHVSFENNK